MVYQEHKDFEKPEKEDIKIWRYIDFTKFVSLLEKRALYFVRADRLPDPFEGSYSKANVKLRPITYKRMPEELQKQIPIFTKELRRYVTVNAWHMNEVESAAMWKLYPKSDEGVAIQSTFGRLKASFDVYVEDTVYIGKVKYIDFEKDWLPEGNILYPFMHKRKSFEHERELRAIIVRLATKDGQLDLTTNVFDEGIYVNVNLDTLIERLHVSPTAPIWFSDLVRSVARKYDLKKETAQSSLADGPVY